MRKSLNSIIKITIGVAFAVAVAYRLLVEKDTAALWASFSEQWAAADAWIVVLAVALMPVCWLLETTKWRVLMRPALDLSLLQGLKAVLGGVAVSLFTPNRIGEYGGRILFVPARYNWRAVIATLVGSFAQNLVHISIGLAGVLAFLLFMPDLPYAFRTGLAVLIGLILAAGILIYFNLPTIGAWLERIDPPSWLRKPWRAMHHLQRIDRVDLSEALFYSLAKYVVFSSQFVLLLVYFDVAVPLPWLICGITVMYLAQTSIPLPPFLDVVVRSEVAIMLWSGFAINELSVLAASFFLWIINLLIPAFFGLIAISSVNVLKSLGYESQVASTDHDSSRDNSSGGTAAGVAERSAR